MFMTGCENAHRHSGVQKREAAGIIKKTNDNKRDRVYGAIEILNILEELPKITADVDE